MNKDSEQSPLKFTKKVVIFCIIFITLYTIIAITYQALTGDVLSETLTERVFTCLIGELAITGMLKIVESFIKFKSNDSTEDSNDEAISIDDVNTDGEGLGEVFNVEDFLNELNNKGE